jgi:hypothetical protein
MEVNKLHIVPINSLDESKYHDFVLSHQEALLYHSLPYLKMLISMIGGENATLVAVDKSHVIRGVLPIIGKKGFLGYVLNSLPYYGSNGGLLVEEPMAAKYLVQAYNQLILSQDVCSATIVSNPLSATSLSEVLYSAQDHRIGQFTAIAYEQDHAQNLMQSFHSKTRNMVRKALKLGIETREENDMVDFLMEVHQDNMRSIGGRAKSKSFFDLFPKYFEAGKDYRILVARLEGKPIAALLLFYFRDTVEYFMPVVLEAYREKQPLSLLVYNAMTEASKSGFRIWNWGGTWISQEGVYLFKKRWGTYDINYTYYTKVNNDDIFSCSKEALINEYPDFFVVPFHLLNH